MNSIAQGAVTILLRSPRLNGALRLLARLRGHGLVLVYHRLDEACRPGVEIIPSVSPAVFKVHLQTLADLVDVVSLDELLSAQPRPGRRPPIALTFDDDLPSHVDVALPCLRHFDQGAAFFLSGRALHACGPYWFQQLEALLTAYGIHGTARVLSVEDVDAGRLMRRCEADAELRRRVMECAGILPAAPVLGRTAIAALADAGMTIGFHTVAHATLPALDDEALKNAVAHGRDELAAVTGTAVRYFAYPHGKVDRRSALAVRRAGFSAAFTGSPHPVRAHQDRYTLGRWEPGPLGVDDLIVKLALRLHRDGRSGMLSE